MRWLAAAAVKYNFVSLKMDSAVRFRRTGTETKWRRREGGEKRMRGAEWSVQLRNRHTRGLLWPLDRGLPFSPFQNRLVKYWGGFCRNETYTQPASLENYI